MDSRMNEAKQALKILQQRYKLFQQQQVTFTTALERCRESALDRIHPVRTLAQVRKYLDVSCNNSTDRRVLTLFLDICSDLVDMCTKLHELQPENAAATALLHACVDLLSPSNDLSGLRAKYPHDVINHLSCDEARNFYGGVISLIPIVLDKLKEAAAELDKPGPQTHRPGSGQKHLEHNETKAANDKEATGVQTVARQQTRATKKKSYMESLKPAWRPTGRFYTS
ncbi:sperm acrosome associated 9 L homeolog isoform X1 [Xenopus laevis]|uniref:Sperm acrosome-associated protein 9 n=2 Tax=Xenopus laevis TaxID=8355 RepID=A0A974H7A8_XENLA|nr:sperm acrosome associated 9 L homeolog isoform X1 [Xenopus laevis]OCT67115.1 hypothetical protein XELAEV_18038397mg [Xenopus laevis]